MIVGNVEPYCKNSDAVQHAHPEERLAVGRFEAVALIFGFSCRYRDEGGS
jgi:hypothetical protein